MASAVGLACVRVWGLRPGATFAEADEPAEAAGIAFQLTNILRDLGEDLARGRVYLPADELDRFGCPPEAWRPESRRRSARLMRFQVDRAREFYRQAEPLDGLLSAEGRGIFRRDERDVPAAAGRGRARAGSTCSRGGCGCRGGGRG